MVNQTESFVRLSREILDNSVGFFKEMNEALVTPFDKERKGQTFPDMVETMFNAGKHFQADHKRLMQDYVKVCEEVFSGISENIPEGFVETTQWDGFQKIFKMNQKAVQQTMELFKSAQEGLINLPSFNPEAYQPETYFKNLFNSCESYMKQTKEMTKTFENLYWKSFGFKTNIDEDSAPFENVEVFNIKNFFHVNEEVISKMVGYFKEIHERILVFSDGDTVDTWKKHAEYLNKTWETYRHEQEALTQNLEEFSRNFVSQKDWTRQFANLQEVQKYVKFDEMVGLNQEIVSETIAFFMETQKQILGLYEGRYDDKKAIKTLMNSYDEYSKMHGKHTNLIINNWRKAWENINKKPYESETPTVEVENVVGEEKVKKAAPKTKKK